ncbi:metal-binding protein [Candidatus Woesearchaeota archaeon]|nr:metal-binding protein [Candidatus Woesearchaeota archaeon]
MHLYKILKHGKIVESCIAGRYAGHRPRKIFGCLDCKSGLRMKKENRVFFHSLEDAVREGYRPCKHCLPIDETDFAKIKNIVCYETLADFYSAW